MESILYYTDDRRRNHFNKQTFDIIIRIRTTRIRTHDTQV